MSAFSSRHRALVGLRPFLILLSLAFGLTGCAPRETPVVAGNSTQTLHRGIGNNLADLDPHLATQAADYNVLSALLEGLVAEDPVDLHPVPGVAQSLTISPDGRTYTFHLRSDARWSNGAPVTAEDFVASWLRMLTPTLGADSANLLYIIQGAEAFHKSTAPWSAVGLAAPDARTFSVTLEHPAPHFLALLNHTAFFPVYLPAIEKSGSATARGTSRTLGCFGAVHLGLARCRHHDERELAVGAEWASARWAPTATATTTSTGSCRTPTTALGARRVVLAIRVAEVHAMFGRSARRPHHELALADAWVQRVRGPLAVGRKGRRGDGLPAVPTGLGGGLFRLGRDGGRDEEEQGPCASNRHHGKASGWGARLALHIVRLLRWQRCQAWRGAYRY